VIDSAENNGISRAQCVPPMERELYLNSRAHKKETAEGPKAFRRFVDLSEVA
jgi:hypothetical protein